MEGVHKAGSNRAKGNAAPIEAWPGQREGRALRLARKLLCDATFVWRDVVPNVVPLVAACMITKNEEKHLPRCLASLDRMVDQINIVDTGSTDRTIEIARSFGANVVSSPWRNDFAFHRNESLDMSTARFNMVVDADEEVVETDKEDTRRHLEEDVLPPILLVREHLAYPGGKKMTVLAPRILHAIAGIRYIHPIHEQLDVNNCEAVLSSVTLMHHGYLSEDELRAKEQRNFALAKSMGASDVHALHCQARAALSLEMWQEVMDAAGLLLERDASPIMRVEACVLGALGAYHLPDRERLASFLAKGKDTEPECHDLLLIELMDLATRYREVLQKSGDSTTAGTFLRPWLLWHDRRQIAALLDGILGRRKAVVRVEDDDHADAPSTPPSGQ